MWARPEVDVETSPFPPEGIPLLSGCSWVLWWCNAHHRNRRRVAPPATTSVIAAANPSRASSRLKTRLRAAGLVRDDGLDVKEKSAVINGTKDGPRDSERARA
jgi:hypothetical protein